MDSGGKPILGSEVFVDAGAWIAVSIIRDDQHRSAVEIYRRLSRDARTLVTTNLVIAEAHALIRRRGGHDIGMRFLESLRHSSRLIKLHSDVEIENRAEAILALYSDHDFSYVDAVSFAVMHQRRIAEAFAFDRDFVTAGFALLPSPLA